MCFKEDENATNRDVNDYVNMLSTLKLPSLNGLLSYALC
jgi:hypothetical protein